MKYWKQVGVVGIAVIGLLMATIMWTDNISQCMNLLKAEQYQRAFPICRKDAEQGDAKAQFNLGVMYAKGRGVKQNYVEVVKWYHKAAEQGYVRLMKGPKSKPLSAVTTKDYISISIYSPAELLLVDPLGNKVGFDPATGRQVETIPSSAYWTHGQYNPSPAYKDPDPAKTIMFNHAIAGVYQLEVIGTGTGTYDLDFEMTDINGNLLLTKGIWLF